MSRRAVAYASGRIPAEINGNGPEVSWGDCGSFLTFRRFKTFRRAPWPPMGAMRIGSADWPVPGVGFWISADGAEYLHSDLQQGVTMGERASSADPAMGDRQRAWRK